MLRKSFLVLSRGAHLNGIRGNFNGARANFYSFRGGSSSVRGNVSGYNNYSGRGWRGRNWGRYGGVYAYGSDSSSSSSSSGCYYAERYSTKYGAYKRVWVCS